MTEAAISYQTILKPAKRLPARARRQLAETLLRPTNGDEQTVLVSMRQFRQDAQARFQDLMDRHNEGQLSSSEREELKGLVARYEALMLLNTETLKLVSAKMPPTTPWRPPAWWRLCCRC